MSERRTLIWWSTGAASAVTARLMLREEPGALIVRCETSNEDPDNYRFEADVMRWLNRSTTLIKSDKYESVWDVWQGRRYMAGIDGAPCTVEMKIAPRLAFQLPTDIHVFGYTADGRDVGRFGQLKANYPELTDEQSHCAGLRFPLPHCRTGGRVTSLVPIRCPYARLSQPAGAE
jgi:hypothetical protein